MKYGIISDIHRNPENLDPALEVLKAEGIEAILANGDINGSYYFKNLQSGLNSILSKLAATGLQVYFQPGSHEKVTDYIPVIADLIDRYPNLHDAVPINRVESSDHHLVFLPGSDSGVTDFEFRLAFGDFDTALYKTKEGKVRFMQNMKDLRTKVIAPEKTIVVCHVPPRFEGLHCIDAAHFWEGRVYHRNPENQETLTYDIMGFMPITIPRSEIEACTRAFPINVPEEQIRDELFNVIKRKNMEGLVVYVERKENRGNQKLRELYQELGIRKAVSGHFHESSQRAHDFSGNPVEPNTLVDELFWNSGCLDDGEFGILTVEDGKVSYQDMDLK